LPAATCPKCSNPRDSHAVACSYCGVVYNKASASATRVAEAPGRGAPPSFGAWNANGQLKLDIPSHSLPPRCVLCNHPTSFRLDRDFSWHPFFYYIFLLLGVLPYFLIALLVRRKVHLAIPLCTNHEAARRRRMGIAVAVIGTSSLLLAIPAVFDKLVLLAAIGFPGLLVGLFMALSANRVFRITGLDNRTIYLRGISPMFLQQLPTATR
jgi:hypothetical protein